MIIGSKKAPYRKILEKFEGENGKVFSFDDSKILPAEQRKVFKKIYGERGPRRKVNQKIENERREKMAQRIIDKLHDERLKEPGKLNSFVYSSGGNSSNRLESEKKELLAKGAKVNYAVMEINGIVIMEALGQFGNATYVAEKTEELEQKIIEMGRGEAIDEHVIYKIIHETHEGEGYNYESNHLFDILDYAIEQPKELIQELKKIGKGCTLRTLTERMNISVERVIKAVQQAAAEKGIDKETVIEQNGFTSKTDGSLNKTNVYEGGRNG